MTEQMIGKALLYTQKNAYFFGKENTKALFVVA